MRIVALALTLLAATALAEPKPTPRFDIAVTKRGFEPDNITVPASTPLTLVFTRKTDQTCSKSVVIVIDDKQRIERDLPLDTAVEIAVTFPKPGKLGFACGMNMSRGTIVVQ